MEIGYEARLTKTYPIERYQEAAVAWAQKILDEAGEQAKAAGISFELVYVPDSAPAEGIIANRRTSLAQISGDDLLLRSQPHYRTFVASTRQSAPLRRIGTFGLAVGAACTFSLGIVGKVLTFRAGA